MSSSKKQLDEFWIGLTVMVATVVLVGGIIWGKRININSNVNSYIVEFEHVNGLSEGTSVVVHGVPKGKVESIVAGETTAIVTFYLSPEIELKEDVTITLIAPQLMGGRVLSVVPGTAEAAWDKQKAIRGSVPAGVGEVMAKLGHTMDEIKAMVSDARSITSKLDESLSQVEIAENLTKTLENLSQTSEQLRQELGSAAASLNAGSSEISSAATGLNTLVNNNTVRLDTLIFRLSNFTEDAEIFAKNLRQFSDDIADTSGTFGLLVKSDSLYQQVLRTVADIDTAVEVIKKNGVKVSIF